MKNLQRLSLLNNLRRNRERILSNHVNRSYSIQMATSVPLMQTTTHPKLSYATTVSPQLNYMTKDIRQLLNEKESTQQLLYAFPHQGINLMPKELNERVNTVIQNLLDLDFNKGDRLAIVLPNISELIITYLAASQIGLIITLLNPAYQLVELEYMLKKSDAKGVVMYDTFKHLNHSEIIRKICPELDTCLPGELVSEKLTNLKHVFLLNDPFSNEKKKFKGVWSFEKLSEKQSRGFEHELPYTELDDPNLIMFTSGTTGKPKGALISQGQILNNAYLSTHSKGYKSKGDIVCSPIPLFHIFGFTTGILNSLISESTNVFPNYFPETLTSIKAIEKYKCTALRGTPTQFFDLLNHSDFNKYKDNVSSLKIATVAGSTVQPSLLSQMNSELKLENIFVGYGITEASSAVSMTTVFDKLKSNKHAYESCGRVLPFMESKIVDPITDNMQPFNTPGELHLKGFNIINKYWDEPEKTAEIVDKKRWFKTGDIFIMDEEGYLYFKSRNKDVIIRGGANIYPVEIENYLKTHPDILAAEVFGVPNKRVGEEICVWIILKQGSSINEKNIKEFCKGNVSQFKTPYYIKFVKKFLINANNKVLKKKMREETIKEHNIII